MPGEEIESLQTQAATLIEQGQATKALEIYEQICASSKATAADHYNMANLLHTLGKLEEALQSLHTTVALEPGHAQAWHMAGALNGLVNRPEVAADCFRKTLELLPHATETRLNLAHALLQMGLREAAITECKRATEEQPRAVAAWVMLGRSHAELGQYEVAARAFSQALKLQPSRPQALVGLGFTLYHLDRWEESLDYFRQALLINPQMARAHLGLGSSLLKMRNLQEALHHMQEATRLVPEDAEACLGVGTVLSLMGRQRESVAYLHRAIESQPGSTFANITLAATLMTLGEPQEAQRLCDQVLAMEPENIEAISLATTIDQHVGNIDKAHERLKPLIEAGTRDVNVALAYSTICSSLGETTTGIEYMEHLLRQNQPITATGRLNLHFNLGKLYDKQKDYELAFQHYQRGNELKQAEFDAQRQTGETSTIISIHTRELQHTLPHATHGSDRPVFVVGMPRSGTSLTEQILASHSDIFGAGELPDIIRIADSLGETNGQQGYPLFLPQLTQQQVDVAAQQYLDHITSLSAGALRVIDKMPGNFMFLGLIELLFPKARIIHTTRNPLDTCLSCYFQNFSRSQFYSYDLANLGSFYRNYQRLMKHWRDTISLPMLEVRYEDMVADHETGSRRIIEFCGLDWEENCLDFHKTERYVATASYDQVRHPIYRSSISRWKNYQNHIGPLIDVLK